MAEPVLVQERSGGTQRLYRFANGRGASVIRGPYTYGGREGLWELAATRYESESADPNSFELDYEVLDQDGYPGPWGYLPDAQVELMLRHLEALPALAWVSSVPEVPRG